MKGTDVKVISKDIEDSLVGGLVDAITFLQSELEAIPISFRGSATLDVEAHESCGDLYGTVELTYSRPETVIELAEREGIDKHRASITTREEVAQLQKLAIKYGLPLEQGFISGELDKIRSGEQDQCRQIMAKKRN